MATFKRKAFYLSGFDPRGARYYHQLYQEQARLYSERWGEEIAVSRRRKAGTMAVGWRVANAAEDVDTDYVFLRWDDIVIRAWVTNPLLLIWRSLKAYAGYIRFVDWPLTLSLPRTPLIALYYPLVTSFILPPLACILLALLLGLLLPWWAALAIAIGVTAAVAIPLLARIKAPWLLRLFIFNDAISRGKEVAGVEARLDLFADLIEPALDEDWDEVLLITHSNGAILALPLMERLLARRGGEMPVKFGFVTLGNCIPLVACRRDAVGFHALIRRLAKTRFRWVDVGFPPDGASYCGVDPLALRADDVQPEITMLSPRWFRFHPPAAYQALLGNKYELHSEYLRSGPIRSPIDYMTLTASARPLAASVAAFKAIP